MMRVDVMTDYQEWVKSHHLHPTQPSAGIPRRTYVPLRAPAETSIDAAVICVEKMGASPELTKIVTDLMALRDRVGDLVDKDIEAAKAILNPT